MSAVNNDKIILSIIIPVYNVEQYLSRCLDSVILQLKDDMEVIIIDDGSKDNSGKICDQYKTNYDSAITVIHQKNGGLSSARNTGIENAHGEYLYFLDSDDYLNDQFIETVYDYLIKRKYDIIEFGSFWQFKEDKLDFKTTDNVVERSGLELIDRLLKNDAGCQIWLRIYRCKLFNDIRFPVGRNYEDIATYYKLLMLSRTNLVIDSQIHVYNVTNLNSITQKANLKNLSDMYLAVNEMHDGLQKVVADNKLNPIYLEYYKRCIYIYILLKLYQANLKDNDTYRQISDYLSKNNRYNYIQYRKYDLRKLCVYKMLKILHQL